MKDQYSEQRINELNPYANVRQNFTDFINACEENHNVVIRIMEPVFRTIKQQNDLYAFGRSIAGPIKTKAKGGYSLHNYGLALDIAVKNEDGTINWNFDNSIFKPEAEKFGLEWGGDWVSIKDKPHFEMRTVNGVTYSEDCRELLQMVDDGKVDEKGYVIFV